MSEHSAHDAERTPHGPWRQVCGELVRHVLDVRRRDGVHPASAEHRKDVNPEVVLVGCPGVRSLRRVAAEPLTREFVDRQATGPGVDGDAPKAVGLHRRGEGVGVLAPGECLAHLTVTDPRSNVIDNPRVAQGLGVAASGVSTFSRVGEAPTDRLAPDLARNPILDVRHASLSASRREAHVAGHWRAGGVLGPHRHPRRFLDDSTRGSGRRAGVSSLATRSADAARRTVARASRCGQSYPRGCSSRRGAAVQR